MLPCPVSFFTIPNKSEGFQTSWNDRQCGFTYELLSNSKKRMNAMNKMFVVSLVIAVGFVFGGLSSAQPEESTLPQEDRCPVCGMFVSMFADWNAKIEFEDSTHAIMALLEAVSQCHSEVQAEESRFTTH